MSNNLIVNAEKKLGCSFDSFKVNVFQALDDVHYDDEMSELDFLEAMNQTAQDYIAESLGMDYPDLNALSSFLIECYVDESTPGY